jgi:hypothetical protein
VTTARITIEIDDEQLARYSDGRLALAWHVAQASPAQHGDHDAGQLAERIGREIIRRWLRGVDPELWRHQGRSYYWRELCRLATYEPGGDAGSPEFHHGRWVPRPAGGELAPPGSNGPGR